MLKLRPQIFERHSLLIDIAYSTESTFISLFEVQLGNVRVCKSCDEVVSKALLLPYLNNYICHPLIHLGGRGEGTNIGFKISHVKSYGNLKNALYIFNITDHPNQIQIR